MHPERYPDIFYATGLDLEEKMEEGGKIFQMVINCSPAICLAACEQTLRNLGVGHIDFLYIHPFDRLIPVERTMEAVVELRSAYTVPHRLLTFVSSISHTTLILRSSMRAAMERPST